MLARVRILENQNICYKGAIYQLFHCDLDELYGIKYLVQTILSLNFLKYRDNVVFG